MRTQMGGESLSITELLMVHLLMDIHGTLITHGM